MRTAIMTEKHRKKKNFRKIGFSAVLAAVLLSCLAAFLLPGGARINWQKVFRFCGLDDFSSCADGSPLAVHVLNVGKADSIFAECGGHCLLVDGGTADCGENVASYLRQRGVKSLDCVFNTHPDSDHIGGLKTVLLSFTVKRYCSPSLPRNLIPNSTEYLGVQAALKSKNIHAEHPKAGSSFSIGSLHVEVLGPVRTGNSTNNNSIVLKLIYGKTRFLLMGDAEKEEEKTLLATGADLAADVLKAGHHGSDTSTTQEFLDAVRPKYAAISVGNDSNNLPKATVSRRFAEAGISVFRTDIHGTIIFLSDGNSISIKAEKS
jgi:competence protein ComEC